MRIQFIEARNFQRLSDGVRVEGLEPGLNIIAGPNEQGKSTLLRALRAGLFERHKAQPLTEEYRPFGQSVDPEVRLGLQIGGTGYELLKVFSKRVSGRTLLQSASGASWQNEDAEHELERLLGFTHASRGKSSEALQGPAGLLWVGQGTAFNPVSPGDEHLRLLHGTLDVSITQMLGGNEGDQLHARITALYESFYDKRGQPRGELRTAQAAASQAQAALAVAHAEMEQFEDRTDALGEKQQRLDEMLAGRLVERALEQRDEARRRLQQIAQRRQQVAQASQALQLATAHMEQASTAWQARQNAVRAVEQSAEALRTADAELSGARNELAQLLPALTRAREEDGTARVALARHQSELRILDLWREHDQATAEETRLRAQLLAAGNTDEQRRAVTAQISALKVDEKLLEEMEAVLREHDRENARRQAGAARIDYAIEPGRQAVLDGQPILGSGSAPVVAATQLSVEGVGRFTVHPADTTRDRKHSTLQELDERMQSLLNRAGVRDVNAARDALRQKHSAGDRLQMLRTTLGSQAPDGMDALRDALALAERKRASLTGELGEGQPPGIDRARHETQQRPLQERAESTARALRELELEEQQLRTRVEGAQSARSRAEREQRSKQDDLIAARKLGDDESLAHTVATTSETVRRQQSERDALEAALAAEDPETVSLACERAEEVHTNRAAELAALRKDCNDLSVELRTLGQSGLAEQVADLRAAEEQASRRLDAVTCRAQAVKLLHEVMSEALERVKRSVSRPILDRLGPYIETVVPGSTPLLDENLALGGLQRKDVTQAFDILSMGTREQIAVLTRLAYADALAEAGQPVCVILDDALVNTDDERLERMHSVLFQASRRYQILVLTCHARAYADAGGRLIQLQDCRMTPGTGDL